MPKPRRRISPSTILATTALIAATGGTRDRGRGGHHHQPAAGRTGHPGRRPHRAGEPDEEQPQGPAAAGYEDTWNFWNGVRAVSSSLACAALVGACLLRDGARNRVD